MAAPLILCFRRDLRLADQPALAAALAAAQETGAALLPVYVHEVEGDWPPGAASRWWLHHSLAALDADLPAGSHQRVWDGNDERGLGAASGCYFARLSAGGRLETARMGLVR